MFKRMYYNILRLSLYIKSYIALLFLHIFDKVDNDDDDDNVN